MAISRRKINTKLRKNPDSDYWLFSSLILSTLVLAAVVLVFYVAATLSLRSNLSQPDYAMGQGTAMMETLNYHSFQPPANFPPQLIKGHNRRLIASQEVRNPQVGQVKFISFSSDDSGRLLADYYKNYLTSRAYSLLDRQTNEISQISALRGKMSFDITIQPQVAGSLVTIYQRIMK